MQYAQMCRFECSPPRHADPTRGGWRQHGQGLPGQRLGSQKHAFAHAAQHLDMFFVSCCRERLQKAALIAPAATGRHGRVPRPG